APDVGLGDGAGAADLIAGLARGDAKLGRMAEWLGLTNVDLAILALVLAPDVDLRYERVYAYLQDDITRKRPSIDLLANLLCPGIDERLALLERFNPCAPLVRSLVVQCGVPAETPLLARPLALDALWRNFLLGRDELDPQLARFARLTGAGERGIDAVGIEPRIVATVKRFARRAVAGKGSLRLALSGPNGSGKLALVQGLAHHLGLRLLVVDLR